VATVATVVSGDFEWDDAKGDANLKKHGVTFPEATTVFDDVDFLLNTDPRDATRFIAVGSPAQPESWSWSTPSMPSAPESSRRAVLRWKKVASMPNVEDSELEVPELTPEWFAGAIQPNRRGLRRGPKRAVFIDDEVAKRFGSDEELEQALRALLQASDHVRKVG
jgi:hypothetical protein